MSERNSAPLTPAVSKASAGAMELMQVHATRSMVRLLGSARDQGWRVLGAALDVTDTSYSSWARAAAAVPDEEDAAARPTLLVLGSEGRGLRASVRRACEAAVHVPRGVCGAAAAGAGGDVHSSLVDSLNVSVAGALLLSALLSRPGRRRSVHGSVPSQSRP